MKSQIQESTNFLWSWLPSRKNPYDIVKLPKTRPLTVQLDTYNAQLSKIEDVWKDTWTDCPYPTYKAIKKAYSHNGNAMLFGEMM